MSIFFCVGSIPVAVFEIDSEILDRFSFQLLLHARVDRVRQPRSFVIFAHTLRIGIQAVSEAGCIIKHIGQFV